MSGVTKFKRPYVRVEGDYCEVSSADGVVLACIDTPAGFCAAGEKAYYAMLHTRVPSQEERIDAYKQIAEDFQKPVSESPVSPFFKCPCGCVCIPLWQKGDTDRSILALMLDACGDEGGHSCKPVPPFTLVSMADDLCTKARRLNDAEHKMYVTQLRSLTQAGLAAISAARQLATVAKASMEIQESKKAYTQAVTDYAASPVGGTSG